MGELRHRRMHPASKPRSLFRTELVRSFVRTNGGQLRTAYEVRMSGGDA
jgi:hypothetical protein